MNQRLNDSTLTALAPAPEPFDPEWSRATLAGIRTARPQPARRRRIRRGALVEIAAGFVAVSTATAVAGGGPTDVVSHVLTEFGQQPNTSGNDIGELHDPHLVAQFQAERGVFAVWLATSSKGAVCYAMSDATWDGEGTPTADQLSDYGCGGEIWVGPGDATAELTRPDQLGGFFKDDDGPLLYGVSAWLDATSVHVEGAGVDRTLPVRSDSHGYGAALPEAAHAKAVDLTFLDVDGNVLGSKHVVAPVG